MILSDRDIKAAIKNKKIIITPKPDFSTQLGACSIDFRLGHTFRVFEHSKNPFIDPTKKGISNDITREVKVRGDEPFIMQPGDFVLAVTLEKLVICNELVGRLEGRSSLGRLGIVVHSTASVFDPGWDGHPVLELGNLGRIAVALYPGMRICSFSFEPLTSPAQVPYTKKKTAKYIGQKGPDQSKMYDDK